MAHTIFSTVIDFDEAKKNLIERNLEDELDTDVSDEEVWDYAYQDNNFWFECERENLDVNTDGQIICIASLGLWKGRRTRYKLLGNNLQDIFKVIQGDYIKIYFDGFNLCIEDSHHDGTNYYKFREFKPFVNKELFCDKLYNGDVNNNDLNRYTNSLRKYVKKIYGW